jgi:serine/threonine protein kinase
MTSAEITMEFMDAGHAGRLAPAPPPVLAAVLRQVLLGLQALHAPPLRALHRDLKPENVLLNARGEAKLADFGVAALLGPEQETARDQQGTILQMSPERLRGEAHGAAGDVWSLGVTALQLATGRHPFVPAAGAAASTERFWLLAEVIKHTASAEECEAATRAAVAAALGERASADLRDFVDRCTATDPAARATVAELLAHPFLAHAAGSSCIVVATAH